MPKTKYGKYIVYDARLPMPKSTPHPPPPPGERSGTIVLYCDDTVIKGAFYLFCYPTFLTIVHFFYYLMDLGNTAQVL
jgi:hypothetical protein